MALTPLNTQNAVLSLHGVSFEVPAKRERVWRAITGEIAAWWPKNLLTQAAGARVSFDARLGGRLAEEWGTGAGLVLYTVVAIEPQARLDLAGTVPQRLGGPAVVELSFELTDAGGGTHVQVGDGVLGRDRSDTGHRVTEARSMHVANALKKHLEAR